MDGLSSSLTGMLGGLASGNLGHALIGLAILVIGLIVVSFVAGFIKRLLSLECGQCNRACRVIRRKCRHWHKRQHHA